MNSGEDIFISNRKSRMFPRSSEQEAFLGFPLEAHAVKLFDGSFHVLLLKLTVRP